MTLLVAAVLMSALVGWVVIYPILARSTAMTRDVTSAGVLDAEARKRVALQELREVEYDYLGGKLDEADYQEMRARISREAMAALRSVEAARGAEGGRAAPATVGGEAPAGAVAVHGCGYRNPESSRFCGGCGAGLA
jgi:cytochrome c-type biogenesis protein CcmH/NrfG